MKHRLARLGLVSYFVIAVVALGLAPEPTSAAYQSTDGGLDAIDPVLTFPSGAGADFVGTATRGIHGEIPVLSGSDLKGEPSLLTQDWVVEAVRDADERNYVRRAVDPGGAPESRFGRFSGWIAAAVVFVAFQILYATIKLGNWLAFAESDRPLGTP